MSARPVVNCPFILLLLSGLMACTPAEVDKVEATSKHPVVSAGGESLQGVALDEATGLSVFRGIPFAASPTGDRRWKPPAAHSPRPGIQQADQFGPACPQLQGNHDWYRQVATLFGNPPETIGPLEDIDEDCLYLNVWTNKLGGQDKRPVMVWIYGGANRNGYSSEPNYHGDGLAPRGVVFVSLNYRVGVMGFMGHPGLAAESEIGVTGNYAILDQIAALTWVQENIEAFGGDPDNVTIFGESANRIAAGGRSVQARYQPERGLSNGSNDDAGRCRRRWHEDSRTPWVRVDGRRRGGRGNAATGLANRCKRSRQCQSWLVHHRSGG